MGINLNGLRRMLRNSIMGLRINHEVTKYLRMGRLYYAKYTFLKLL